MSSHPRPSDLPLTHNCVQLVGRLASPAEERTLPSGDVVSTFRLIVDRTGPGTARGSAVGRRGPSVDTFDCAAWTPSLRRRVMAFGEGEVLSVDGRLRRRFWRAGGSAVSRVEVEVQGVRRFRSRPAG